MHTPPRITPQGFGHDPQPRLPMPPLEAMDAAQRQAAQSIIDGPRKAVLGPFLALLRTPALMERVGKLGESLRFDGSLPARIRELVICAVARETGNQFEWQTHAPLAVQAGVAPALIEALHNGRPPHAPTADECCALDFSAELLRRNGVSDASYADAVRHFGEAGTVELTVLVGYFALVCWVMNVARTPGPAGTSASPLQAFPA